MAIASLFMTIEPTHATLHDLNAEIGQVLVYWSFLESEMRNQLTEAGSVTNPSRVPIISRWRAYLSPSTEKTYVDMLSAVDRVAAARNLLAHGIQSVSADPWQEDSATVTCATADRTEHVFTIDDIRELSEEIDRVRLTIRRTPLPASMNKTGASP